MGALFVPAVHLPHGSEVFKPLGFTRAQHRRILKALSERALLGCSPDDAIVLSKTPESGYLDFLLELGIGTRNIIICSSDKGNLAEDILGDEGTLVKIRALSPSTARFYIHLEEEEALARETGLAGSTTHPALTRMFNTIYFLVRLEEDLEIGALERVQARSSRLEGVIANLLEKHPKLFVRGNESCGGSQAFVLRNADDLLAMNKIVCRNQKITRYFASRFIEGADSWNYQFLLDGDGGAIFFGASRQILRDGYLHEGNEGGGSRPGKRACGVDETGGAGFRHGGARTVRGGHTD